MLCFLSLLLFTLSLTPISLSQPPPPRALLINCGATTETTISGRLWLPDTDFITTGTRINFTQNVLHPTLSTVRSFPLLPQRKFCYVVPVYRTGKYLVRTSYYYYGGSGEGELPPVFDQIVDGSFWSVVNTTEDYGRGDASYYEGVFRATGKSMSVCLASNVYTTSDPFISGLEFVLLGESLYNSTDFGNSSLRLVARHSFGYNGSMISYPDDQFDRYWEPYGENTPTVSKGANVSIDGFWNLPPRKVFQTQWTVNQPRSMEIPWPLEPLRSSVYYIALYFAEDTVASSRTFNITINNVTFYDNLRVPPTGVALFANRWPLSGLTKIVLTPASGSTLGPLINGGEILEVIPVGGRTHTRDLIGLNGLKNGFQNPPFDWNGDPCLPKESSWTGVTCSNGSNIRVTGLNLTGMNLLGSLSPNVANLTALSDLWLGNNNLSGSIPDLSTLRMLKTVHLEDNRFNGPFPSSLANIDRLQELYLQSNNLTGQVPSSLKAKLGSNLRVDPQNS
ncbi:putative non-specific serine/threonine protein kinase [Helianthus annuus]|nr:putative non-specific serine/threonine protein kinase [Helianthus annuus]KAJ0883692.1 putative non-specific serine/threonine protein kinase [Helianthus annuus]